MTAKRIFWPLFRVVYLVSCIIDVTILVIYLAPPKDGDLARAVGVSLLMNTLMVIIGWAFLPWPRPELTPAAKVTPLPKVVSYPLEDVCGQQSLEDYLEKKRAERNS